MVLTIKEQEEKNRGRHVTEGSISKERLYKRVEQISGFNHVQTDAIMACITDAAVEFMRAGYIVQLGDLGYLPATVTSHSVQKKKDIHAGSVHFNNVDLRISGSLRKRMRSMSLQRVDKPVMVSPVGKIVVRSRRCYLMVKALKTGSIFCISDSKPNQ